MGPGNETKARNLQGTSDRYQLGMKGEGIPISEEASVDKGRPRRSPYHHLQTGTLQGPYFPPELNNGAKGDRRSKTYRQGSERNGPSKGAGEDFTRNQG